MKMIGIVCEGDRDFDMLCAAIQSFMEEECLFTWLQPNPEFGTEFGNGWKGVWRWCETNGESLNVYLNGITPRIDLLIIQMDADVARCEKEIYCYSIPTICSGRGKEHPLNCSIAKDKTRGCPQQLPPNNVCDGNPESRVAFLTSVLDGFLFGEESERVVITIPCDSTDAWVLAAFEDSMQDIESFCSPWDYISKKKDYHGIRVSGHGKTRKTYNQMINKVCEEWNKVSTRCPQARCFEECVRNALLFDGESDV